MARTSKHNRCTYCGYRRAAGTLTTSDNGRTTRQPCCLSCAEEALIYYALRPGASALFTTTELCC